MVMNQTLNEVRSKQTQILQQALDEASLTDQSDSMQNRVASVLSKNRHVFPEDIFSFPPIDSFDKQSASEEQRLFWYSWQSQADYLGGDLHQLSMAAFGDDITLEGNNHDIVGILFF